MKKWVLRGQVQAPVVSRPPRPESLPKPPPPPSGLKPSCRDCGSTSRALHEWSKTIDLCYTCTRERKKAKKLKGRAQRQMRSFGITLEEGEEITAFQGGGCICAEWTGYNGNSRSLSTDHDHQTGEVRGKLCKHCNDLLGRVKDNPEYFRRMIDYLENPPARQVLGSRVVPGHVSEDGHRVE